MYPTNYDNTVNAKKLGLPQMREDIAQNEADIAALDTRVTTAEGTITQNTSDISQNANDISSLGARVGTAEDDIDDLETRMTDAETDITNLNTAITSLNTTVAGIPVVEANRGMTADETLTQLVIDGYVYDVPQGGGGGSSVVNVVYEAAVEVGDINYSNFLSNLSGYRRHSDSPYPASISPNTQYNIVLMANEDEGNTRLVFPAFTFVDNSLHTHYIAFLTGDPNTPVVFATSTRLTDQEPT